MCAVNIFRTITFKCMYKDIYNAGINQQYICAGIEPASSNKLLKNILNDSLPTKN